MMLWKHGKAGLLIKTVMYSVMVPHLVERYCEEAQKANSTSGMCLCTAGLSCCGLGACTSPLIACPICLVLALALSMPWVVGSQYQEQ